MIINSWQHLLVLNRQQVIILWAAKWDFGIAGIGLVNWLLGLIICLCFPISFLPLKCLREPLREQEWPKICWSFIPSAPHLFLFFLSPAPFAMLSGKCTLWKPQKEIITIFLHLRGCKGSPVLQKPGPSVGPFTCISKIKRRWICLKGQRPN